MVSYTDPTAGNDTVALQDLVGNDVASFSVTVNTPATGAPTITGTAQVDQTLTAVTTGIMDADGLTSPTYTYQWIRVDSGADSDIAGARSSTYTLAAADEGKTIKVQVTFEDDDGNTETLTSAATATVVAAAADTTPPEVKSVAVDRAGSSVSILFDEDLDEAAANVPPVSAFSVTADGQDVEITRVRISFGDIVILELPDAAISPDQTVVVSYTDPTADNDIVALQDRVGNDVASFTVTANTPATGAPTITGTVEVGQTLTAVTTGIMDANGLTGITYNHQWLRVNGTETSIERADVEHLHPGRRRPGQDHQGAGGLQGRRRLYRAAHQRGHGGGRGSSRHHPAGGGGREGGQRGLARLDLLRRGPGRRRRSRRARQRLRRHR